MCVTLISYDLPKIRKSEDHNNNTMDYGRVNVDSPLSFLDADFFQDKLKCVTVSYGSEGTIDFCRPDARCKYSEGRTPVVKYSARQTPVVKYSARQTPVVKYSASQTPVVKYSAARRPLSNILKAGRPLSDILQARCPLSNILKAGRLVSDILQARRPLSDILQARRPLSDILQARRPLLNTGLRFYAVGKSVHPEDDNGLTEHSLIIYSR